MECACAAAGIRMNAGHLVLAYMPPYFDNLYPVSLLRGLTPVSWAHTNSKCMRYHRQRA